MNLIQHIFSEATVQAIGWTLLHSLWQGAMVALILGGLLVLLHRHSARIRYRVAGGALLAQLLLSTATFAYFYVTSENHGAIYTLGQLAAPTEITAWQEQTPASSFGNEPLLVAQVYFAQHLPLIVMAWLLGLLAMLLRFVGGVAYTQRLRHYRTNALGGYWHELAGSLGQKMGVSQTIRLVESAMVHVPLTIGYLKPVILLPLGAVAGLSQQQVEAILAHELAHILRKDYLFNLLQSIIEILFFYHPAVWWMSAVVRAEREHCCDDLAVAACGDSLTYARALAELEAMRQSKAPALAMALAGRKGSLLSRIKRLLSQPSLRPTFSEGFMAALVLIVGLVMLSYGAVAGLKPVVEKEVKAAAPAIAQPVKAEKLPELTEPGEEATAAEVYTVQDTTGQAQDVVIIKNKKGKVTELYVNGKRIPDKDIPKYTDLVNQRLQAAARAPKATPEEVAASMKAARAAANKPRKENEEYRYNYNYTFSGSDSVPPVPPAPPMPPMPAIPPMPHIAPPPPMPPMPPMNPFFDSKEDKKRLEKEQQRYKEEMEKYKVEIKRYEKEMKEQPKGAHNEQRFQEQMKKHEEAMGRLAEQMKKHEAAAIKQQEQAKKMQDLREELEKDGLIKKDAKSLDLRLDNSGLYIDGKKQPQEVYEKYRKMTQTKEGKNNTFSIQINDN